MKYKTGDAFRQALDVRIKSNNENTGMPLPRLRKMVAFDRFLVRLFHDQHNDWVIKGGFTIQLRLGKYARTTKDIDLLAIEHGKDILTALQSAGLIDIGDYFRFEVGPTNETMAGGEGTLRFNIQSWLANRRFETFHIDVGVGDPMIGEIEYLETTDLLEFADIPPTRVPCYPIPQQIAEKLHALTRAYATGTSTRAKDLVDILLLAGLSDIDGKVLKQSIHATFNHRNTHPVPDVLPAFSSSMRREYNRIVREHSLNLPAYDAALEALAEFVNPVLQNQNPGNWYPTRWTWE